MRAEGNPLACAPRVKNHEGDIGMANYKKIEVPNPRRNSYAGTGCRHYTMHCLTSYNSSLHSNVHICGYTCMVILLEVGGVEAYSVALTVFCIHNTHDS